MGLDYSAITVIGIGVDKDDLLIDGQFRSCYHDLLSETAKFCPECGKPAYQTSKVFKIPELKDYDTEIGENLDIVYGDNYNPYYFGLVQKGDNYHNNKMMSFDELDLVDLKRRLKEFLEPYDLWDESSFGLYTILEIS